MVLALPAEARRLALVVGNDNYRNVTPLKNARADAKAVGAALTAVGFDVLLKQDVSLKELQAAVREFKARIAGGDEVIFYFSGHGVQFEGTNYLIPVDIVADNQAQVADDAMSLQHVLDSFGEQKARFTLAIVDACRDNPFRGQGRAIGGRGLVAVSAAKGEMIVYSAGAGEAALDRLGSNDTDPNGVFTRVLVKQIGRPGVPADRIMKLVQSEVVRLAQTANHQQVPAIYDGSIGDFFFRPGTPEASAAPVAMPTPAAPPAASVHVPTLEERDELFWGRVKESTDVQDFDDYKRQFPKGVHTAEAALMERRLTRKAEPPKVESVAVNAPRTAASTGNDRGGSGDSPFQSGQRPASSSSELVDFGVPAARQIHGGAMHGETPTTIPGGRVITSPDLIALYNQSRIWFLPVDALGDAGTLPGAYPAAWAAAPGTLGDAIEQRLGQSLNPVTRGNKDTMLVFFCQSTHCWMSYNAALRAIDLGYRNVWWYRGGIEAWLAAGMSTVPPRPAN
jgi:PQQ-dependent catabolism-associated CXXCW motif protein